MKETNQEPETKADPAVPRPFGTGVELGAFPEASPVTGKGAAEPRESVSVRGDRSRRPTTFRCALGRTWGRANAVDLDEILHIARRLPLDQPAGPPLGAPFRAWPAMGSARGEAWLAEVLAPFDEEGRGAEVAAHFEAPIIGEPIRDAEVSSLVSSQAFSQAFSLGPEVKAVLVRWSLAQPFAEFCHAVVGFLSAGRPVILLSDPTLPILAETLFDCLVEAAPGAPIWLLHEDGLDVLRHAASQPDVAIDWVEPNAGLLPGVASVRKIRAHLEGVHAGRAAAEALERERAGWFGSGVVAAPLAPLRIRAMTPVVYSVDPDLDPADAASEIVTRAFGPHVLGGFSCTAVNRVQISATSFSAVSEAVIQRLGNVESDPCFDPPFWVLDRPESVALLPGAKRLGLDEGATLIFEREEAREDDQPYGMVFTNGEERMRTGGAARTLGVLLLMRGAIR